MNAIVFLGPTMSVAEARTILDARYLPPASQGDVLLAARQRPLAIGIIDGYFERVPAVWHKEILWAMREGVHVFGASSMGALRAAELSAFGMKGVGKIFDAFSSGALEDDDEVALVHAAAENDFRPASEPMVNIRATLMSAVENSIVSRETARELEVSTKALFYPDRNYGALLDLGRSRALPQAELNALASFIAVARVDQKRDDAILMLKAVETCCQEGSPLSVTFSLAMTDAWVEAKRQTLEREASGGG